MAGRDPQDHSRGCRIRRQHDVAAEGVEDLVPQTTGWNIARFGLGVVCLLPFLLCLDALRRGRPVTGRRRARYQPRRALI